MRKLSQLDLIARRIDEIEETMEARPGQYPLSWKDDLLELKSQAIDILGELVIELAAKLNLSRAEIKNILAENRAKPKKESGK